MGVSFLIFLTVLGVFLGTGFQDGSWRPQKLQNQTKLQKTFRKCDTFFKLLGFNCGLAGQVHGDRHCNDGFVLVCNSALKSTCCTCKSQTPPGLQVQQVVFTADVQTRTNPWPQSLQSWVCSGLQIRPEVDLLHLQVPNTP